MSIPIVFSTKTRLVVINLCNLQELTLMHIVIIANKDNNGENIIIRLEHNELSLYVICSYYQELLSGIITLYEGFVSSKKRNIK